MSAACAAARSSAVAGRAVVAPRCRHVGVCLLFLATAAGAQQKWDKVPAGVGLKLPLCLQMRLPLEVAAGLAPVTLATAGAPTSLVIAPGSVAGRTPSVTPMAGTTSLPGVPAPVESAGSAMLLARLRAGDAAPDVLAGLQRMSRGELQLAIDRCDGSREENFQLSDTLVQVLLAAHQVDPLDQSLSSTCSLRVADALQRVADKRCVAIYERLSKARETAMVDRSSWVGELQGLALYYRRTGAFGQAAATWLRASHYTGLRMCVADYTLEAARDQRAVGNVREAANLYAQAEAAAADYPWLAGIVVCDRATCLMEVGRHREARELLAVALNRWGQERIGVALRYYLGISYLKTRDLQAAATALGDVVRQSAALDVHTLDPALGNLVVQARARLNDLDCKAPPELME